MPDNLSSVLLEIAARGQDAARSASVSRTGQDRIPHLRLSEIKHAHTDDGVRQEMA